MVGLAVAVPAAIIPGQPGVDLQVPEHQRLSGVSRGRKTAPARWGFQDPMQQLAERGRKRYIPPDPPAQSPGCSFHRHPRPGDSSINNPQALRTPAFHQTANRFQNLAKSRTGELRFVPGIGLNTIP